MNKQFKCLKMSFKTFQTLKAQLIFTALHEQIHLNSLNQIIIN